MASNQDLVARVINGKTVYGTVGSDGSFLSQDKTIYESPSGQVETGITDPATDQFIPNGSVRTIDGKTVYGTVQSNGDFLSENGTLLQRPDGFVEHGKIVNDSFLAQNTVNGKTVWGNYGPDGSFLTEDDKTYVTPDGKVETGITDPATGQFIPNGSVRTIDGKTVYGSVLSNGDFLSEDGTLLQRPDGFVEHGKIVNDSFLAQNTVNGVVVWGNYSSDGSFLEEDGKTYVTPDGKVETGVTTPGGSFLPGGTTLTLAGGAVLFGYMTAGTFYTYDGSTLVLHNGTVLHGTLNQQNGVFTGNNGDAYFIGKDGVIPATKQADGSYTGPDGGLIMPTMTPESWKVDLEKFSDAMQTVQNNTQSISDAYDTIKMQYDTIEELWVSPAGTSFADITSTVDDAMNQLNDVLDSIYSAMQSSYTTYQNEEQANVKNFTGGS